MEEDTGKKKIRKEQVMNWFKAIFFCKHVWRYLEYPYIKEVNYLHQRVCKKCKRREGLTLGKYHRIENEPLLGRLKPKIIREEVTNGR